MSELGSNVKAVSRPRPGRKRLAIIVVGCLLMLGVGATAAFKTDSANLNFGAEGVGAPRFDIAVITAEGIVSSADPAEGIAVALEGENTLVPGRTVSTTITVFNNSPTLASTVQAVVEKQGNGQVGAAPNITSHLRFTMINNTTGDLVMGKSAGNPKLGAPIDSASGIVGLLEKRGMPALLSGELWTPGATEASRADLTVIVHYLDSPETESLNGGRSAVKVRLLGTSTD